MNSGRKLLLLGTTLAILFLLRGITVTPVLADEPPQALEAIRQAAEHYYDYTQQYHISADRLYDLLHDGDQSNNPRVISVQSRAEYERAHIPGAINIPWEEITDIARVEAYLAKDKPAVIYCNHAVYSAQLSAMLNLLGYNTLDLAYGFESWTQDQSAIPDHFDPTCVCEHTVDTTVTTAEPTYRYPQSDLFGDNQEALIRAAANNYFNSDRHTEATICPCDLEAQLLDDDPTNDPFVLSLQWPKDYAAGHIPQAVNIPRWELFNSKHLSQLPTDRPIVICCYLGFTSSQVAAILNMMGYNAQVSLHGLSGWTLDPEIVHFRIDDPQNWRNYPIEGTAVNQESGTTPNIEGTASNQESGTTPNQVKPIAEGPANSPIPDRLPVTGNSGIIWLFIAGLGLSGLGLTGLVKAPK